jgi:integrase/recombinase XerD
MKTRPQILFLFRKDARHAERVGTIVCRITVRGISTSFSTGIRTMHEDWSLDAHRLRGRSVEAKRANEALTKLEDRLNDIAADLDRQDKIFTAKRLHQLYQKQGCSVSLLQLFVQFLGEKKTLVGVEVCGRTVSNHGTRHKNLSAFLEAHNLSDLRPEEFTHNLADKMLYWLIGVKQMGRNTALKNLQNISQVLSWGVRRDLLDKNPMALYSYKLSAPKDLVYLSLEEVEKLTAYPLVSAPLQRVRDSFIFQCWTGLAYADLAALNVAKQAEQLPDGRRLLRVRRQKSTLQKGYECVIPLLPEAERILALYKDNLPVPTNQVYNRFLKEIGAVVGLSQEQMNSHIGRKTAGVMMLNAGIRMEVVSKFLGHSSVKMTETVYAKILDKTLVAEFDRVFSPQPPPVLEEPTQESKVVTMWKGGQAA